MNAPATKLAHLSLKATNGMTLWIVLALVLIELSMRLLNPTSLFGSASISFAENDPLAPLIQSLSTEKSDILLLSSSLGNQLKLADGIKREPNAPIGPNYFWAKTLDKQLSSQLHVRTTAMNLSFGGAFVSEYLLLLQQALDAGNTPKLLILLIAPRDFIANSYSQPTHLSRFFSRQYSCERNFSFGTNLANDVQLITDQLSVCNQRPAVKSVVERTACGALHRVPNTYYASRPQLYWDTFVAPTLNVKSSTSPKPEAVDLEAYRRRIRLDYERAYTPLNRDLWKRQSSRLATLLQLARANSITTLVINMPRTSKNDELLCADFRREYTSVLQSTSERYGAKFVDFNERRLFEDSEFVDDVHLSDAGAAKCMNIIAKTITDDRMARAALTARAVKVCSNNEQVSR